MSKQRISYVVYDNYNNNSHNAGINSLALDTKTPGGILYTAGKDSKINSWDLNLNSENVNPYIVQTNNDHNTINENYTTSNGSVVFNQNPFIDGVQDEYTMNTINNDIIESPESIKGTFFRKYVHSDGNTRSNSFSQAASAISIKNPLVRLKQQSVNNIYSHQNSNICDLKRKMCSLNKPTFRKNYSYHSDWVNDIVLTKNNDYLLSASSDRSIYLWNINKSIPMTRIGSHKDDVRTLAYSALNNWVASGGFDQRVLFWDIAEGRSKPIFTSDDSLTQASIYSMATNEQGNILVTGSPERIVRIWDTKMGKQVLKLTGHSDNVRALIVSSDGKWVLSGSSDATIKLWSLANTRRCVLTYSHYTDSVWSLTSNDPYLNTFWAGGRDGWITKVCQSTTYDTNNQYDNDYGDCVLISKENSGVVKLAAIENGYIWAATNSSTVNCWRDAPLNLSSVKKINNNVNFEDYEKVVIPKSSIIIQPTNIINDSYYTFNHIQSVASVDTIRSRSSSIAENYFENDFSSRQACDGFVEPIFTSPETSIQGQPAIVKYTLLNNKRNVLTKDTEKNVDEWDIILCKKIKSYGKVDYNKVLEEINKKEWIENWCSIDIRTGSINVIITNNKIFESYIYFDECKVDAEPAVQDTRINLGRWVLTYLFYNFIMAMHEKKMQNQIENSMSTSTSINGKLVKLERQTSDNYTYEPTESNSSIRCLTPIMLEESFSIPETLTMTNITEEDRENSQKGTLKTIMSSNNSNINENEEENNTDSSNDSKKVDSKTSSNENEEDLNSSKQDENTGESSQSKNNSLSLPSSNTTVLENQDSETKSLDKSETNTSESNSNCNSKLVNSQSNSSSNTPTTVTTTSSTIPSLTDFNKIKNNHLTPINTNNNENKMSSNATNSNRSSILSPTSNTNNKTPSIKYTFSDDHLPLSNSPSTRFASGNVGDNESYKSSTTTSEVTTPTTSNIKVKEKSFIKKIKSHVHRRTSSSVKSSNENKDLVRDKSAGNKSITAVQKPKSPEEIEEEKPINFNECPYISLPDDVPIIISNLESDDAYSYIDIDRQTVKSLGEPNTMKLIYDYGILPKWVYDCVIEKKIPNIEVRKINFVLKPYPGSEMAPLPTGNNHLCANRMLRMRKVIAYIVEKLGLVNNNNNNNNKNTSNEALISLSNINESSNVIKAENWIEVLCNETILEPTSTLATCKYHYWKTGGDVVLNYRYIVKEVK